MNDSAKQLAEILTYNKDLTGKAKRSAKPGDSVSVTLGGNSGVIKAVAGTVLKGGNTVAVVKTPNGPLAIQGQTGGSLGVDVAVNEFWEEKIEDDKILKKQLEFLIFFGSGVTTP